MVGERIQVDIDQLDWFGFSKHKLGHNEICVPQVKKVEMTQHIFKQKNTKTNRQPSR